MKNLFLHTVFILTTIIFISCDKDFDDEQFISPNDLPEVTKTFINTHFADIVILRVEKENHADEDGSIYKVVLTNGLEIDFDRNGNWTDIDGGVHALPKSVIPEKIQTFVTTNYNTFYITSIEIKYYGYNVDLSNDWDLYFDKEQNNIPNTWKE